MNIVVIILWIRNAIVSLSIRLYHSIKNNENSEKFHKRKKSERKINMRNHETFVLLI